MKWFTFLKVFLFLKLSLVVQSANVIVPWESSSLKYSNVFTVFLGDIIHFEPCGDSESSNLIYTNSRDVFTRCTPQENVSSEVAYHYIGNCNNPLSELTVVANSGAITFVPFEIYGSYFFLSNDNSDCENGVKAVLVVLENRPITDEPPAVSTVPGPTASSNTQSSSPTADNPGLSLPVLATIVILSTVGIAGAGFAVCFVTLTLCYCKDKRKWEEIDETQRSNLHNVMVFGPQ